MKKFPIKLRESKWAKMSTVPEDNMSTAKDKKAVDEWLQQTKYKSLFPIPNLF